MDFEERIISNEISPLTNEGLLQINEQMRKCFCLIYSREMKSTGFFCKIPFPKRKTILPVLITANHVLNEEYIKNSNNTISFSLDNGNEFKEIFLKNRIIYTNRIYDITIIELNENDNINNFLELDKNLLESQILQIYSNLNVYLLQYARGEKSLVSFGLIKNIDNENGEIRYNIWSDSGSGGGPILSTKNFKVIGIHIGAMRNRNLNIGRLLNKAIIEFQQL